MIWRGVVWYSVECFENSKNSTEFESRTFVHISRDVNRNDCYCANMRNFACDHFAIKSKTC